MKARLELTDSVESSDPKLILTRDTEEDCQLWIRIGEEGCIFALSSDDVSALIAFIAEFGSETV